MRMVSSLLGCAINTWPLRNVPKFHGSSSRHRRPPPVSHSLRRRLAISRHTSRANILAWLFGLREPTHCLLVTPYRDLEHARRCREPVHNLPHQHRGRELAVRVVPALVPEPRQMVDFRLGGRSDAHRPIHDFTLIKSPHGPNRPAVDPDYNKGCCVPRVGSGALVWAITFLFS